MNVVVDWFAFLTVFAVALLAATAIVTFYAFGLRLMVRSGHAPVVTPAEFTDAITVISEKEAARAAKQAAKAARKNPLSEGQKRLALVGAYGCFGLCVLAVIGGILLLVIGH